MNERPDIERRLTDALQSRASDVEPADERAALDRINRRMTMNRNRTLALVGVAAAIAVVIGAVLVANRDDKSKQTVNVAETTSTSVSTTTSTTTASTPTTALSAYPADAIWPFAESSASFDSAGAAALSFATNYLGMTNAQVQSQNGATVALVPNSRSTTKMTVQLEQTPRGWFVTGATSDAIVVDAPHPHARLTPTLTLDGQSQAFEAQLGVQLRALGATDPLATATLMGGSTEMQPFHGTIGVPSTSAPLVLVIFEADASGEQTFTTATVVFLDAAS